jgi:Domain of unknown function (DUF1735)
MRKLSLFTSVVFLLFTMAGCLKDKRFDDNEFGITTTDIKGVALTQASASPVVKGITGSAAAVVVDGPLLTLETSYAATEDVGVTLAYDQALVTAAGLTPLPAGTFSTSTLTPVIATGSKSISNLKITVNNSNVLDPNIIYGIGYRITGVSGAGFQAAGNMKTVVIAFAIKNKYDGIYRLQGYHNRVPYTFPYDTEMHLVTVGPSSVIFYWPEPGVESNGHPIGLSATSMSWYGPAISPVIVFNQATDLVTDVYNNPPNATVITMFTGAGSRISRYVPATKAITVDWNYNGNPLRAFFDDLTYISPRP